MTALRAFCELSEDGRRIEVHFPYSPDAVEAIRTVPGRRFVRAPRPHWTVPATLTAAQRLREAFGAGLQLGDAVKEWGREQVRAERNIATIRAADDAELRRVPPAAAEWLRPYQRADVAQMAHTSVLNANQPGVGKTVETIYAIQEAALKGPHLIVCPMSLFKDPWRDELERHAPDARIIWGSTPAERRGAINWVWEEWRDGTADNIFLLLNPEMVRVERVGPDQSVDELPGHGPRPVLSRDHKGNAYVPKDATAERLFEIKWGAVVADEFHKFGLGADRNTLFARGLKSLRDNATRAYALSGTPMGGKPVRLWGVLNFIDPDLYSSKWRWAEEWLVIDDNGFGKKIGGLQPGREEAFYHAHSNHMIRRARKDALPGLPDKVVINVECPMTSKQRKAYDDFQRDAEAALEGGRVVANGVLAEYARLKQLANALCEIVGGDMVPTDESGKLPILLDRLDTYGIRGEDPEPGARAIVASESQRFVEVVERYLIEKLARAAAIVRRLDGTVTGAAREEVIDWYKADSPQPRVLVMTTQTGGVGLNLGMTDSMHILDETWNPDDQEQLEDRGMRNRTTALNVLYYRTQDSIQEYIWEVAHGKQISNRNVLEIKRLIDEKRNV